MDSEALIEQTIENYKENLNPGLAKLMQFAGFADVEESAEDCILKTASGAEYLDFVGGFGVFSVGHRHPKVIDAVKKQLDKLPLSTRTFFNAQQGELAAKLGAIAPGDLKYSFFSNSGAEAVEASLKFARIATGKVGFVSTEGAYHGKTFGALSVTGREKYRLPFEPLVPGASFIPFNDLQAAEKAITNETAAMIIEVVQGEGGIHVAKSGYLAGLRKICDERGALLIVDEVQTGIGRTGKMFAVEHEGISPDIMALAKALGGGVMPIGATLMTADVANKVFGINPMVHTSTFGGNPMACAPVRKLRKDGLEQSLPPTASAHGVNHLPLLHSVTLTAFKIP